MGSDSMFKQVFKYTLGIYLWKRYKRIIVSTPILFLTFWLISVIHQDFVDFLKMQGETQYLGRSFLVKWGAFLLALLVYVWLNFRAIEKDNKVASAGVKEVLSSKSALSGAEASPNTASDPFAEIRTKDQLRSKSDLILSKK